MRVSPPHTVLYAVVRDHLDGFLREFLTCGVLARGFCPSCGGRRMRERAAHLIDEILPRVPVRQDAS